MGRITLEQVDRIRERTNVTYEAAKAALEATDGDMLEAMILLERQGKTAQQGGPGPEHTPNAEGFYSTRGGMPPYGAAGGAAPHAEAMPWREILQTCWSIVRNCTANQFEIWRQGRIVTAMPVLVLLLLLVFVLYISGPLLLAGLLFGCRYRFSGPDLGRDPVNCAMEKMHTAVDEVVDRVKEEFKGKHKR